MQEDTSLLNPLPLPADKQGMPTRPSITFEFRRRGVGGQPIGSVRVEVWTDLAGDAAAWWTARASKGAFDGTSIQPRHEDPHPNRPRQWYGPDTWERLPSGGKDLLHDRPGIVSLEPGGAGRFAIAEAPMPSFDGWNHVIGEVVAGMEVVGTLQAGDVLVSATVEGWAGEEPTVPPPDEPDLATLLAGLQDEQRAEGAPESHALLRAAWVGDVEAIERELGSGVDVNARDPSAVDVVLGDAEVEDALGDPWEGGDLASALDCAAAAGRLDAAEVLLDAGARVTVIDTAPLLLAVRAGSLPVVSLLLERSAPADDGFERLPLDAAAELGRIDVLDALLDAGATVDETDEDGATSLMSAAAHGRLDCVRRLLDAGADPARWSQGETALSLAARAGHRHVYDALFPLCPADVQQAGQEALRS